MRPALICGTADGPTTKLTCTCSPISAVTPWATVLYGTCTDVDACSALEHFADQVARRAVAARTVI